MRFDVRAAYVEVTTKSKAQIEKETAYKWGSRAIACFQLYHSTGDTRWFLQGEDHRHEAIEHAAFAEEPGLIERIRSAIDAVRAQP